MTEQQYLRAIIHDTRQEIGRKSVVLGRTAARRLNPIRWVRRRPILGTLIVLGAAAAGAAVIWRVFRSKPEPPRRRSIARSSVNAVFRALAAGLKSAAGAGLMRALTNPPPPPSPSSAAVHTPANSPPMG